jgi:hypothetical protein
VVLWIDADETCSTGTSCAVSRGRGVRTASCCTRRISIWTAADLRHPGAGVPDGADIQFYGCVHEQPQQHDANTDIFPTLEPFD